MDSNLWNVRMTMRMPSYYEVHRMFYFNLYSMNNDQEMRYLWTISPQLAKEGIHILVEFDHIQRQNIPIPHDTNTTTLPEYITAVTQIVSDEPSMLYNTVNNDDDEVDESDGDDAVPSQSKSDDDNNPEEGEPDLEETRSEKNRSLVYYKLFFNSVTSSFQIPATVNNSRIFLTSRPFRSRIWTPTVEDERAQRVQSENPQRLTVRRVLPMKNKKTPSVTGGLKGKSSRSLSTEGPFLFTAVTCTGRTENERQAARRKREEKTEGQRARGRGGTAKVRMRGLGQAAEEARLY
ncbi:hypothetical protein M9H77_27994 [Catharanthus roseus]|uniref:Uncharacterized protein n=1 Tax=Catharanthus roseus TaxID=4058 RepID=A0ACC0AEQ7_CATRO|nr:hypothetical protein M9H77_27994 [Catharanthus roseus]